MYRPLRLFATLGSVMFVAGLAPFVRFLVLSWFTDQNGAAARHVQSLVLGSVILIAALLLFALGVIAELIRINRPSSRTRWSSRNAMCTAGNWPMATRPRARARMTKSSIARARNG